MRDYLEPQKWQCDLGFTEATDDARLVSGLDSNKGNFIILPTSSHTHSYPSCIIN
jgi:hypothetical protein